MRHVNNRRNDSRDVYNSRGVTKTSRSRNVLFQNELSEFRFVRWANEGAERERGSQSFAAASRFRAHYFPRTYRPVSRFLSRVSNSETSVPHTYRTMEISGIIPRATLKLAVRLGVPGASVG